VLESQMFAFSEPKRAAERLTLQNQQLALSAAIASAATPRAEPCCSSPAVLEGSSPLPCACRHPSPKNSPVWALLPEQPFPAGPDSMAACGRGAGRQRCRQRHARQRCRQGHGRQRCRQAGRGAGRQGHGRQRHRQAGTPSEQGCSRSGGCTVRWHGSQLALGLHTQRSVRMKINKIKTKTAPCPHGTDPTADKLFTLFPRRRTLFCGPDKMISL